MTHRSAALILPARMRLGRVLASRTRFTDVSIDLGRMNLQGWMRVDKFVERGTTNLELVSGVLLIATGFVERGLHYPCSQLSCSNHHHHREIRATVVLSLLRCSSSMFEGLSPAKI